MAQTSWSKNLFHLRSCGHIVNHVEISNKDLVQPFNGFDAPPSLPIPEWRSIPPPSRGGPLSGSTSTSIHSTRPWLSNPSTRDGVEWIELPYKLGYKTPPLIRPVSFIRPCPRISFHQNRFIRPGLISNLPRSVCSLPLTAGEIKEVMDRGVAASW